MTTTSPTSSGSRRMLAVAARLLTRLLGDGSPRATSPVEAPRLLLGLVADPSSDRQPAPAVLAVPQGAALSFEVRWDAPHEVDWRGVRPLTRHGRVDRAEIELPRLGRRRIEVTVASLDGRQVYAWTVQVDVLPNAASEAA